MSAAGRRADLRAFAFEYARFVKGTAGEPAVAEPARFEAMLTRLSGLLDLFDKKSTSRVQTALGLFAGLVTFAFYFAPDHPAVDTGLGRLGALMEVVRQLPAWAKSALSLIAVIHLAALAVVTGAHAAINDIHVFPIATARATRVFAAFEAGQLSEAELRDRYLDFQAEQVELRDRWFDRQRLAYFGGIVSAILFVVVAIVAAEVGRG